MCYLGALGQMQLSLKVLALTKQEGPLSSPNEVLGLLTPLAWVACLGTDSSHLQLRSWFALQCTRTSNFM